MLLPFWRRDTVPRQGPTAGWGLLKRGWWGRPIAVGEDPLRNQLEEGASHATKNSVAHHRCGGRGPHADRGGLRGRSRSTDTRPDGDAAADGDPDIGRAADATAHGDPDIGNATDAAAYGDPNISRAADATAYGNPGIGDGANGAAHTNAAADGDADTDAGR